MSAGTQFSPNKEYLTSSHPQLSPLSQTQQSNRSNPLHITSNTLYFTARTSTPNKVVLNDIEDLEIMQIGQNGGAETRVVIQEEDIDQIEFAELDHKPPHLPSPSNYSNFGRSKLRDSIIARQSNRLFPPQDYVAERMEEQIVRWGAPQSTFRVDDILNGKHTFQKEEFPVLEVRKTEISSKSVANSSLGISPKPITSVQSHFIEDFRSNETPEDSANEVQSFSDHPQTVDLADSSSDQFQFASASFSSSMYRRLNGENTPISSHLIENHGPRPVKMPTPEAALLNEEDLDHFVKNRSTLRTTRPQGIMLPPTTEYRLPTDEIEDMGCLEVFQEVMQDAWDDLSACLSCSFVFEEN